MDKRNLYPKKKASLLGSAVIIGIITVISKIMGLFRDILVANFYGMTMEAKAYEAASSLPVTIFDLVLGGVVTAAFIPVFNSVMVKEGKDKAFSFANSYVNFILMACIAISILGISLATPLIRLIAPGLDPQTSELAAQLTRIMFPMIIFTGLAFSFVGILQSLGEFNLPAVISLVSNVIMVAYLFTLNKFFGIVGLSVAMLLGWASQAIIQMPKVHKLGFRYTPKIKIFDNTLLRAAKNAVPILIGTWVSPLCNLINKRFASTLEEGRGMTALGYANRLYIIIVGIFSFVATNLLFPYFSRAQAEGDREGAEKMIKDSVKVLIYIIAPITIGIILLSGPFTSLIYERGAFTSSDSALTAAALSHYAVGMIFMAANEVMTKAIFSVEKPKLAMISSLVAMAFNILVVSLFSNYLGVGGIALISGIATAINLIVNIIMAHRIKLCIFRFRDYLDFAISLVSAASLIPVIILTKAHITNNILVIVVSVAASIPVYFIVSRILHSAEAVTITDKLMKRKRQN